MTSFTLHLTTATHESSARTLIGAAVEVQTTGHRRNTQRIGIGRPFTGLELITAKQGARERVVASRLRRHEVSSPTRFVRRAPALDIIEEVSDRRSTTADSGKSQGAVATKPATRRWARLPFLAIAAIRYGSAIAAGGAAAIMGLPDGDSTISVGPPARIAAVFAVTAAICVAPRLRALRWGRPYFTTVTQLLFASLIVITPQAWPFAMAGSMFWIMCIYGDGKDHLRPALAQLFGLGAAGIVTSQPVAYWCVLGALAAADITKVAGIEMIVGHVGAHHEHLRGVIEGVNAIVWSTTSNSKGVVTVSEHATQLLGWPTDRWAEPGFLSDICADGDASVFDSLVHTSQLATTSPATTSPATTTATTTATTGPAATTGSPEPTGEATIRIRRLDGSVAHIMARVLPVRPGAGGPVSEGLFVDISRRVEAETQLRRFAEVTSHSPIGCIVVDVPEVDRPESALIAFGNPVALNLLHISDIELAKGIPMSRHFNASTAGLLGQVLASVARTGNPMSAERLSFPEIPGSFFNIRADRLSDGSVAVTFEDVTARVRSDERLRHQALHDALTGLPNRVQLDEALQDAVYETERQGRRVALLLMDLTQFKEVNDAMGHRAGDQLLVDISARLSSHLSEHARLLARLGGDEFALVTNAITGQEEAVSLARRALEALERPFEVDGVPVQSTANIGVALCPDHAASAADLLKMADVAMYRAKRTGQGYEVYSTDTDQSSLRRVTLLGELRRAMAAGELQLHYQPAIDLRTGRVAKVEALVRWQHQHHGLMMPQDFIELAETSGMIHPLTRWIIVEAGRGANRMHEAGIPLTVSANISVKNLQDPDLVSFFELLIRTDDFRPDRMELEITETELMDDPVRAFEVLDRLRGIGLSAAIDDFGIGQSSLQYLRHMPVNQLKIDRGFITSISSDEDDRTIVDSTINLAHSLKLQVTAEGVPNEATLRMLARMGCDYACGFYLSEAVSLEDLPATVERLNATVPSTLAITA